MEWYPATIPPLNPWKQYIQAKRESGSPLSLISSLLLCRLVCRRTYWQEDNLVFDWHAICEGLVFLVDQALTSTSSNLAESGEGGRSDLTKEHEIALDILRDLDDPNRDGIYLYRYGATGASLRDPDHPQSEEEQYCRWRDEFDVDKSWYTDDLIHRLFSIAGSDTALDEDGFVLWRVRRLKDIRDQQDKAAEGAGAEAEGSLDSVEDVQQGSALLKVSVPSNRSAPGLVSARNESHVDVALILQREDGSKGLYEYREGNLSCTASSNILTHN